MNLLQSSRFAPFLRFVLRPLLDPYRRYQHAKLIHATRVALGILLSIAVTALFNLPHGEWATISLLIVIAGLQHHGNIRRKAIERAFGTLIGGAAGLLLLVEQEHFGHLWFTWLLMAIACGVCAYYAVGKGGYIALLSAITLVIVAGHGDNELVDGFWRAVNVLIGIVIALLFSFALPLYATWSWRYKLAGVLRECAAIYTRMLGGPAPVSGLSKAIAEQRAVLVQLRSLMPSVSAEVDLPVGQLDAMQRELQLCISTIELLPAMLPAPGVVRGPLDQALPPSETLYIREMLVGASRALKQGSLEYLHAPAPPALPGADAPPAPSVPPALQAYAMLTGQLYEHDDKLRALLLATAGHWNI